MAIFMRRLSPVGWEWAIPGFVRLGCACYTTREEIDRVIEAVRAVAAGEA